MDPNGIHPGWLGATGLLGIAAMKGWDWFLSRKSSSAIEGAGATLFESFQSQLKAQDLRLATVEQRLASETVRRIELEEEAGMLRVHIASLEGVLRANKIDVPRMPPSRMHGKTAEVKAEVQIEEVRQAAEDAARGTGPL